MAWDEARGVTLYHADQEEAQDYRYFPGTGPGAPWRSMRLGSSGWPGAGPSCPTPVAAA
jgi:hypothetical protein